MDVTRNIEYWLIALDVFNKSAARGNIPTNNMISHNIRAIDNGLFGFRDAQKTEPLCKFNPATINDPKNDPDEVKAWREENAKWMEQEETVRLRTISEARISDQLGSLSSAREFLKTEDELDQLREAFSILVGDLGILTEV